MKIYWVVQLILFNQYYQSGIAYQDFAISRTSLFFCLNFNDVLTWKNVLANDE